MIKTPQLSVNFIAVNISRFPYQLNKCFPKKMKAIWVKKYTVARCKKSCGIGYSWHSCSVTNGKPPFYSSFLKRNDMKLKTIIAVAAIGLLAACDPSYRATDTGVVVVPEATRQAFVDQYPDGINVVWSNYDPDVVIIHDWDLAGWPVIQTDDYAVRFDMGTDTYYAWYDNEGTWIGTAYVVKDYSTMPLSVRNSVTTLYPGYTITAVNKEFYRDRVAYEITLKNVNDSKVVVLTDMNGNVIKSKVKNP
jgi:hypothetical protein